jgi:hypothetical protein
LTVQKPESNENNITDIERYFYVSLLCLSVTFASWGVLLSKKLQDVNPLCLVLYFNSFIFIAASLFSMKLEDFKDVSVTSAL